MELNLARIPQPNSPHLQPGSTLMGEAEKRFGQPMDTDEELAESEERELPKTKRFPIRLTPIRLTSSPFFCPKIFLS
ncbi:MAG: hypothetical protein AB1705_26135, partial [Verrucomicrobiota bacterium]